MDYNGKLQHSHSANYLSTVLTVGEETKAEIRLNRNSQGPMNMSAELTFLLPGNNSSFTMFYNNCIFCHSYFSLKTKCERQFCH